MLDERTGRPLRRLHELLAAAAGASLDQEPAAGAEQALWALWSASRLGLPLVPAPPPRGGQEGRAADRDLDAVVALFEAVARFEERRPRAGVRALLDELQAQEIPSQSRREGVLAGQGAVRLLTAHRSKGLEWDLVVVASRAGRRLARPAPPRLPARRRPARPPTVLDRRLPPTSLLVDERRLFYVAVTRARRRLVVTAVRSPLDDGDRPSRFLAELGVPVPERIERPTRLLSLVLAGRTAAPRRWSTPASPSRCARLPPPSLARLAAHGPDGLPLVPAAHPDHWWGIRARARRAAGAPRRRAGGRCRPPPSRAYDAVPVASGSSSARPRRRRRPPPPPGFGLVVHALANMVATGAVPRRAARARRAARPGVGLARLRRPLAARPRATQAGHARSSASSPGTTPRHAAERGSRPSSAFQVPYEDAADPRLVRPGRDSTTEGRAVVVDFKTSKQRAEQVTSVAEPRPARRLPGRRARGRPARASSATTWPWAAPSWSSCGWPRAPRRQRPIPRCSRPGAAGRRGRVLAAQGDWADELVRRTARRHPCRGLPRSGQPALRAPASFARVCPAQDAGAPVVP